MWPPRFWSGRTPAARLGAAVLTPLGIAYGATVAWKRRVRSPYRARIPVICVGNLTVGGTGKTPIAIAIARLFLDRGVPVAFLTRGYGRRNSLPLVIDAERHDARTAGDEALLLARIAPTIVAADRAKGARLAEAQCARVIIMDDGHQNFSLQKNFSLVVVDGETGFDNGSVLPAGPLREPIRQGLQRADAVVVMGDGDPSLPGFAGPVLRARLSVARRLDGRRVVAFAGIGRPQKFFDTLRGAGAEVAAFRPYADHHPYTTREIAELKDRARRSNAELITTEKDFARLNAAARDGIDFLQVRVVFDDEAALTGLLESVISKTDSSL